MSSIRRAFFFGGLLASSVLINACVGDDPPAGTSQGDGGPSGVDAGQPPIGNDSGPGVDAGEDSGSGGACDGGLVCGGSCTVVSEDPKNCGRCDHDCGSATCVSGVCQAVVVAGDALVDDDITSLTTDQTDDNPEGLAQKVFWSVAGTNGGVFQDNVIGGNKLTLSSTPAVARTNVVVSGANAYWFGQNFGGAPQPVLKSTVNTAGTTPTSVGTINGPFIQSILYDAVNKNVLGSYSPTSNMHGTFKCPGSGGTCVNLTTFSGAPGGNVATDLTNIYFCAPDDGIIFRSTLNGGNSGTLVLSQATPNLLRVDGTNLYWSNSGTKTIQRAPVGIGAPIKQMASTTNAANAIAADAVNVYWTDNVTGTLNYAPITGAGPNTAYVTLGAATKPMRLVRDQGFLYFTHKGGVYRVALP